MQRFLIIATAVVLVAAGALYSLRGPLRDAVVEQLTADMFVSGRQPQQSLGPAVGSHFPGLRALHEERQIRLLDSFAGPRGTVLVASRSLVWCPYCMADVEALSFKTLGILHEDYRPGDEHYGIPHPGMIVVAPDGTVAGKLFLEGYRTRVAAAEALAYAQEVLGNL